MQAKTLDEYHEDKGPVVWWSWDSDKEEWLGEPAYIGSPLDDNWPGYHTHWTPHPELPPIPLKPIEHNDFHYVLERLVLLNDEVHYSRDGDTAWFDRERKADDLPDWLAQIYPVPKRQIEFIGNTIIDLRNRGFLKRHFEEYMDEYYSEYDVVSDKGRLYYFDNILTIDWPAINKLAQTLPMIADNGKPRPSRLEALVKIHTFLFNQEKSV